MNQNEFRRLEFETLRREIEISRDLRFKLMTGGTTVVPAAQFLSQKFEIGALSTIIPVLVVVIAVLFIAENNAIMRCGRYIRTEIESNVDGVLGWEHWLESQADFDSRLVDRLVLLSFYALMAVYFAAAVLFAIQVVEDRPVVVRVGVGCLYAVAALTALAAANARPHSSTRLREEKRAASGLNES